MIIRWGPNSFKGCKGQKVSSLDAASCIVVRRVNRVMLDLLLTYSEALRNIDVKNNSFALLLS